MIGRLSATCESMGFVHKLPTFETISNSDEILVFRLETKLEIAL